MIEKIQARLQTLKKERETFVQEANKQLAAYSAAIAELENLLKEDENGSALPSAGSAPRGDDSEG